MSAGVLDDSIKYKRIGDVNRAEVVILIKAYIEESCPDIVASESNATALLDSADLSSHAAMASEKVVGFTLLCPINNLQLKMRILHAVGTYVSPEYRRRRIGESLRRMAMIVARDMGYDKLQGVAYSEHAAGSVGKLGGKVVAAVLETSLKPVGE